MKTSSISILAIAIAILAIVVSLTGCTDNSSAKLRGGAMTIDLPPNQKLVNATWKENSIWYLTRPSKTPDVPEVLTFAEKSEYGLMEGKVIFREH